MPYCSKCGKEVTEEQNFCPSCGANLRPEEAPIRVARREKAEKKEKEEKAEKSEKEEKREKEEPSPVAAFVGGVVFIFVGIAYFLISAGAISLQLMWPYLIVALGLIIILAAIYAGITARKRSPRP